MIVQVAQKYAGILDVATLFAIVVCMAGCGQNLPETAGVHGRITYDGIPIAADLKNSVECEICFWPDDGRRPARGDIDGDGHYVLTSFAKGDVAIPVKYTVTIKAVKVHPPSGGPHAEDSWLEWLVPRRYADQATSGLTAIVKLGENEINFDIPREE